MRTRLHDAVREPVDGEADTGDARIAEAGLDRAYRNFFEGRARYPRFKSRRGVQSARVQFDVRHPGKLLALARGKVLMPGLGELIKSKQFTVTIQYQSTPETLGISVEVVGSNPPRERRFVL